MRFYNWLEWYFWWRFCLVVFGPKWDQNKNFKVLWKIAAQNFSNFLHKVIVPWRLKLELNDVSGKNLALRFLGQKKREMSPKWSFSSFVIVILIFAWNYSSIKALNVSWISVRRLNLARLADTMSTLCLKGNITSKICKNQK